MATKNSLLDPARWQVTLLPLPMRQRSANASGLCGGFAVGASEGAGFRGSPCWWPQGNAQALTLDGQKRLGIRRASGRVLAGFWERASGENGGALGWRLEAGELQARHLHPDRGWQWTAALGAGGDAWVGYGLPKVAKGEKAIERALCWHGDGVLVELPTPAPGSEALAEMTDGRCVVGRVGRTGAQRAALWPLDGSRVTVLGADAISEAYGVGDGEQVGVRWSGRGSSAALWRGSAESLVDLTPRGFQSAIALACAGGYQVGSAQRRTDTAGGSGSMLTRATLWAGTAASCVDLQQFLPPPWNASVATAVEIDNGLLRIAGNAQQVMIEHELTRRESHLQAAQRVVLWEIRLN
jgi:hypothetical protein